MRGEEGPSREAGKAFWDTRCQVVPGEDVLAAVARGKAAQCATEALELLRAGDIEQALNMLDQTRALAEKATRAREYMTLDNPPPRPARG